MAKEKNYLEQIQEEERKFNEKKEKLLEQARAEAKEEIAIHVGALVELAKHFPKEVASAVRKDESGWVGNRNPSDGEGKKGKRMTGDRMKELMGMLPSSLKKNQEYSASEIAELLSASSDEIKSVMIRAKADGILVGNGKVGKAGRSKLK